MTSDMMHNRNCYAYLLQLKPFINEAVISLIPSLAVLNHSAFNAYNKGYKYGDLYSTLITTLEDKVNVLYKNPKNAECLDPLVYAVYHNDNGIIEETKWLINKIADEKRPINNSNRKIRRALKNDEYHINQTSPMRTGSFASRLASVFSKNFKPQLGTNLPSLKRFSYKEATDPTEYRMGTQAQRHNGHVRISPLFIRWLRINAQKAPADHKICHVYFNNLSLDRDDLDFAGQQEKALTLELQRLEKNPDFKIAVITLPASKGLMDVKDYQKTKLNNKYQSVYDEFLQIATNLNPNKINDFYISQETLRKISGNDDPIQFMKQLLTKSFNAHGLNPGNFLSNAQKQAVWVHFTKYELPNYIINQLKPRSYNFTCKDGIDRGAVSSAYYNLMKSFELNKPLSKEEFTHALESSAANVKARGMNSHRHVIWNALDSYINNHHNELMANEHKAWVVFWRDMNCPHERVPELLALRINQCRQKLTSLPPEMQALKKSGLSIIYSIEKQCANSGKRLLLEVISRTLELLYYPSAKACAIYKLRAKELPIRNPGWYAIAGLMQIFIGLLLLIPSFGFSNVLITKGVATARSGFFASERKHLSNKMLDLSEAKEMQAVAG